MTKTSGNSWYFCKSRFNLSGKFFPCKECSGHFLKMIKENPFPGGSRTAAMLYVCKLHNIVNKRLGKPTIPCEHVDKIWGQKDCGCDPKKLLKKYQAKLKREKAEAAARAAAGGVAATTYTTDTKQANTETASSSGLVFGKPESVVKLESKSFKPTN